MTEVPVLLLIFNRPSKTEQLIKHLSKIKPRKIFVGADGPRNPDEKMMTDKCRHLIDTIHWECHIERLYRSENLGVQIAVSSAISWFFEKVDSGIILEDDCLPDPSFFSFSSELLQTYQDDHQVMHISALNSFPNDLKESFHFSRYPRVWGWATWKRAWEHFSPDQHSYLPMFSDHQSKILFPNPVDRAFWRIILEKMIRKNSSKKLQSWAYLWALSIISRKGKCITPNRNLVRNIGFDEEATFTGKLTQLTRRMERLPVQYVELPLKYPENKSIDTQKDYQFLTRHLIDNRWKLMKTYLKVLFPFLPPLR